ncbi:hypothetical protein NLI96_g6314 [Meripilus lineatus]|uniref:ATP-dependent DNA helicase n=1 Tax=Meripilus lineatus TaxID=2056292 RepID=A0AAD5V1A6_9APHY|nr:hypothetical protein NLI96_g6314 [Physisporinus lineatus]
MLFHHKHPNVSTHDVRILSSESGKTLTVVGGALPRVDGDDFNEYAKVMLMFFNPHGWRTGLELKSVLEQWSDAFHRTNFSPKAVEVMRNMHALYECRDERHDLAAKRRQLSDAVFPSSLTSDPVDHLDEDAYIERQLRGHEVFAVHTVNEFSQSASEMSMKMRSVLEQMNTMRTLLAIIPHPADPSIAVPSCTLQTYNFPHLVRSSWKKMVTRAREEAVQSRIPSFTAEDAARNHGGPPLVKAGIVEIIEPGKLQVLSSPYQLHEFKSMSPAALVEQVAIEYCLNEDQRRAYGLTCRDILYPTVDRLRLILTGMAGTGKSRVIKALIALLAARNESYRFVVMAPTGSAAALVNGSTYHSILAFGHDNKDLTNAVRDRLRKQLEHVDLFFLDEMSMISCRELCSISRRLSAIYGNPYQSFGGKTMILVGDFAQLPPIAKNGPPLYSTKITAWKDSLGPSQDLDALGKGVWYEFRHVVILRENMRQTGLSENELKFRRMLDNLRYADCSKDDLALLHSRVLSDTFPASIMNRPEFNFPTA